MKELFEFAAGSIAGRSHRIAGRNNQDAYYWLYDRDCSIAVVCDGCGSGAQSEVGAKLGAPLIAQALMRRLREISPQVSLASSVTSLLEQVRCDVLSRLRMIAEGMGDHLTCIIDNYFLFTAVSVLITPSSTAFFGMGDGVFIINGGEIPLGPFPDNAPPYLAYGLLESSLQSTAPDLLRFQIHRLMPTSEMQSFLIGTDGVQDLMKAAGRTLPGKVEPVGPISLFWREDRYFANPDMIRRRLAGVNRDVISLNPAGNGLYKEAGLLHDDTTLIVGRRIAEVLR